MVPEQTQQQPKHRRLIAPVSEDTSTLLWRITTLIAALGTGITVASKQIWESWYNEIKNTEGFRELRTGIRNELDALSREAAGKTNRSAIEKFKDYVTASDKADRDYSAAINARMKERFGIVSGWKNFIKGTWQRLNLIGWNNKTKALITGFGTTVIAVGGMSVLRENNRLWKRLDEARQNEAENRSEIKDLLAQMHDHAHIQDKAPTKKSDADHDAAANHTPLHKKHEIPTSHHVNDNKEKPRTQMHTSSAELHNRMVGTNQQVAAHG